MEPETLILAALRETEALLTVLKILADLPDHESRARVMAIVSTKLGFYEEAVEFNRAARAEEVHAASAELAGRK